MRFQGLDLNLLIALHVLLKHRSVTQAAEEIHLSQSAMSGALNRLREYFQDDLLIQCGRTMVPTTKAMELSGPLNDALSLIRNNITTPATFDPAASERRFLVVCTDYVFHILVADILRELDREAPQLDFDLMYPSAEAQALFAQGEVDLLITVEPYQTREQSVLHTLFDDEYAVICWAENDACANGIDADLFCQLPHVATKFGASRAPEFSEICLAEAGIDRNVALNVYSFSELPTSIVGTQRLAVMHRRHAEYFTTLYPIQVHPLPFELPVIRELVAVHQSKEKDAGVNWLLQRLQARAAALPPLAR